MTGDLALLEKDTELRLEAENHLKVIIQVPNQGYKFKESKKWLICFSPLIAGNQCQYQHFRPIKPQIFQAQIEKKFQELNAESNGFSQPLQSQSGLVLFDGNQRMFEVLPENISRVNDLAKVALNDSVWRWFDY